MKMLNKRGPRIDPCGTPRSILHILHFIVNELEFDLNQLREARPDLAPENLDTDGLVHFYRKVSANESRPLSVDEIVNVYHPHPVETVGDGSSDNDKIPNKPI